MKVQFVQRLTVYSQHPLRDYLAGGADRSFVTGRNAGIREDAGFTFVYVVRSGTIEEAKRRLYCCFRREAIDMQAAQQELARETPVAR